MFRTREEIEEFEQQWLAPYAEKAAGSRGRDYASDEHPYRTAFQKDRDRIMYTTAFRRLQYKTQVFVNYEGDYYRTRLTHTQEAAQIARTVARSLRANEDLAEAITLAHDLGHSPFGHSGEITLDRLMLERMGRDVDDPANKGQGFNHTVQTLRIVERLEKRWTGYRGLNLTWETREGIVKHATEYDEVGSEWRDRFEPNRRSSIEAQIVNYADELTYSAHDLDDGLRSGMLSPDMPALQQVALWREIVEAVDEAYSELTRHRLIRKLIDRLITDLVTTSAGRIVQAAPRSPDEVRAHPEDLIAVSPAMADKVRELKDFLYANLYRHPRVIRMFRKAERTVTALFEAFEEDYRQLPAKTRDKLLEADPDAAVGGPLALPAYRVIADYIAGMTDRFALQEYQRLFDPSERA
ncbi:MAG: Deoxyguanosinetriphosphate triphosphohydrolase-like protein [Anaerolineales bacterium]|nr:Deoxyguanosinetriphosphate triphosphohydrolase-like protein [Anaerolineales bacterium]